MSNLKEKLSNRMLQNQLDDFLDDYGIGECKLSVAFEHFCNYCMLADTTSEATREYYKKLSIEYSSHFDPDWVK